MVKNMEQRLVESVQFWLDTTNRPITVNERIIRVLKNKFVEMLDADIKANTEMLQQSCNDKRLQMIGFMQSLRDELKA